MRHTVVLTVVGLLGWACTSGSARPPTTPSPARDLFGEALRFHKRGEEEAALDRYVRAAEAGHFGARCFAAVLSDRLRGTETASVTLTRALAERPNDLDCRVLHARELIYRGELLPALAELDDVVARAPDDAFAHASRAFALFRLHRYQEAAQAFSRAAELDLENATYVYNAAYARYLAGQYRLARPLYEKALSMGLGEELVERAREELAVIDGVSWVCPMHAHVVGAKGARCSECGMPLAPADREHLELE